MASKKTIGGRIELSGTKEVANNLKSIKTAMQTVNSESKLLNAEFKGAANSMEALEGKYQNLSRKIGLTEQALTENKKALEITAKNYDKCKQNVAEWEDKLEQAERTLAALKSDTNSTNEEIEEQEKVLDKIRRSLEQANKQYRYVENSMQKYETAVNNTQAELFELNRDLQNTGRYLDEAKNSEDGAARSIDEFGKSVKNAEKYVEDFADGLESAVTKGELVAGAIETIAGSIVSVGQNMFDFAVESEKSMNKVAAATGATGAEMDGLRKIIQEVYNDNFGGSMEDVADVVTEVKQSFQDLNEVQLKDLTESAFMLNDVLNIDMNESLIAVKNMASAFGITADQAMNMLAQGAQNGANATGELSDVIREYSDYFADAGYSAEDMMNVLINGANKGVVSIDKVARHNWSL